MNNWTDHSQSYITLEEIERTEFIETELPVTVYLSLLSIIGTIGNLHAIIVYSLRYKPSNHRVFVVWLAVVDLVACFFSIPFEIFDIRFNQTFQPNADTVCKIFRYLNHFVSLFSGTLLGVIAVERFRKVCKPFGRQLSQKESKIACFVTVIASVVLSTPALFMYGVVEEPVTGFPGLNGTDCTTEPNYKKSFFYKAFNFLLLFICTTVFVVCVVVYSVIGKALLRQYKFRAKIQNHGRVTKDLSSLNGHNNGAYSPDNVTKETNLQTRDSLDKVKHFSEESSYVHGGSKMASQENLSSNNSSSRPRLDRSKQITLMFLVATAISYLGYLPYLILTLVRAADSDRYQTVNVFLGPMSDILLRGYFINNATNPLVYCFLDVRFRTECKEFYKSIFRSCCKRIKISKK